MAATALWIMVLLPALVGGVLALTPRAELHAAPLSLVTASATPGPRRWPGRRPAGEGAASNDELAAFATAVVEL